MSITTNFDGGTVIYDVSLPNRKNVHMTLNKMFSDDERFILFVDAKKFAALWASDPRESDVSRLVRAGVEAWKKDYKYEDAEMGFSKGTSDPVPVVCVHRVVFKAPELTFWQRLFNVPKEEDSEFVTLNDGVTRTIWLLANDAPMIPIECDHGVASRLWDLIGYPEHPPQLIADLRKQSQMS